MTISDHGADSTAIRTKSADRLVTLFTGTKQPTVKDAAVTFFYEGLSVVPLMGKKATVDWIKCQREPALPEKIHFWHRSGFLKNVGVVCGDVSHNLVVMDLDGEAAVEAFEGMFPELLSTFTVFTGSGKGKHYYYRVQRLPRTKRLLYANHNAIEMRANGCYVVTAPSIHPDTGNVYRVPSPLPIMTLGNLDPVVGWMLQLERHKQNPKPAPRPAAPTGEARNPRYAEAALEYECRDVRRAAEGRRNEQLNRAAYNLGQIVADGHLPLSRVENALLASALAAGLNEREARATIRSGITAGQSQPRSQQWQSRQSR
jgi:hypothetical protein